MTDCALTGHLAFFAKPLSMERWHDFFVAEVGASAALAGLVIVAISINIQEILKGKTLPGVAGNTLAILVGALMTASLALVPANSTIIGPVLAIVTLANWLIAVSFLFRCIPAARAWLAAAPDHSPNALIVFGLWSQAATLPLAIGGVTFALGDVDHALYWVAAGILLSFLSAIRNTWILLVEILR
jgi:hypothetical protein